MANPVLDKERAEFLKARIGNSPPAKLSAWPRPNKLLPVVDLEVSWVRLSTLNHRTKAEQLREEKLKKNPSLFNQDPLGPLAQDAQYLILKSQERFTDLKADLKERRQQEPGIVTAEGVLINGNRRAAALRSLYLEDNHLDARYIQCFVLPEDATPQEIIDLETELQIAQDFREDYSWINEALLIQELYLGENRDFERVAAKMHRDVGDIRSMYEKIQQVNQLVQLSGGSYLHIDFEPHQSAFDEMTKYIKNKSAEEKESVRTTYFLGTLAQVNYRELRHLRRSDAASLVHAEIISDPTMAPILEMARSERGAVQEEDLFDDLLGGSDFGDLSDLLSFLAKRRKEEVVQLADGRSTSVEDIYQSLQGQISAAAREAQEGTKDKAAVTAPISRVNNAVDELRRAIVALPIARPIAGWSEADFVSRLTLLKQTLASLESVQ